MQATVETIDRTLAEEYLKFNRDNRKEDLAHIASLVLRQQRGEWVTNGDSIRFDADGNLRDGQHRLRMVVQTEQPIDVVVVRGIDPRSFITMDTGKKRTLTDVLSIKDYAAPRALGPALIWVRRYITARAGAGTSHEQHIQTLEQHPDLEESVAFFLGIERAVTSPAGVPHSSMAIAMHYLCSRIDRAVTDDFIERYVNGLAVSTNDPVHRMREQVIKYKSEVKKTEAHSIWQLFANTWDFVYSKREAKQGITLPKGKPNYRPTLKGFPKELLMAETIPFGTEFGLDNGDHDDQEMLEATLTT